MAIQARLADGRVLEFPDGTDPQVVQATVKRMIAPQQPEDQAVARPSGDFSIGETISNIPSSAVQLGEDLIQPILNPIDTAVSVGKLGAGALFKANEALAEATPEFLDFMSKPLFGDEVFGETQAPVAEAVGEFINERYGSAEAFKNTVQQDPVGALADIAGLFTGGATLLPKTGKAGSIAKAVESVGKAVDPLNLATSAVKTLAKSGKLIPQALPEKLLQTALKFRPSINPTQRLKMTQTALKQGIMPTVSGLDKITQKLGGLNTKLDAIVDKATSKGKSVPVGTIFSELRKVRKELGGIKVDAKADLRIVNNVAKDLGEQLKKLDKKTITPRELQDLKTNAYTKINFDIKQGQAGFAKNEARKGIAKSAKQKLEGIDPEIQPTNRDIGGLLELQSELEGVVGRLDNRNLLSLDTATKVLAGSGAGAAIGDPVLGTIAGITTAVAGSPRVKARTALILENIRKNADTIEIINNTLPPVLARSLLEQAGRIDQSLKQQVEDEE